MLKEAEALRRHSRWQPAFRLIASRFPPIDLFERVADPADWEMLYALESLTNPRIRDEIGQIQLVPVQERVSGPGASIIMASFTHLHPSGSRFADAQAGAFYAGESLETAIAETRHHREQFLRATAEPPTELELRCYLVDIAGEFHDLRGRRDEPAFAGAYAPSSYVQSQAFARELRQSGSNGICYDSVRRHSGQCIAVFRPRLISNVRQSRHLRYVWDGTQISTVYELKRLDL
jgi:hypothetical protein